jgi:Protein-L-isoaspartate(D-aspartate) O-methyltransferase (PCMT)
MNILLYRSRRTLLKLLIPEFVWPKSVLIDGAEIKVRNTPYSFGVKRVLKLGEYELDERRLLSNILQPGDVVVEMGGSIGILTAIIAEKVGSSGFVTSVEASVKLAEYSRTWLESGNNVRVLVGFGFPVWELKHPIEIQKFEEKWGSMSGRLTFRTGRSAGRAGSNEPSHAVYDLRKLSEYGKRPPTTLVVDIEGSERIICSQKPEFPQSLRNLLIELHPDIYGSNTKEEIVRRIEEEGFRKLANQGNVFLFTRSPTG